MSQLPVIVGFGGYNASGRSSFHHGYRRTILDSLNSERRTSTLVSLASIMGLIDYQDGSYVNADGERLSAEDVAQKYCSQIEENTLIRSIDHTLIDPEHVPANQKVCVKNLQRTTFTMRRRDLPSPVAADWIIEPISESEVRVTLEGDMEVSFPSTRPLEYQAAAELPKGFNPADQYSSRFHPRGLQLSIIGASDAINSMGIPWQNVVDSVNPDQIATYACSALGQTDDFGLGGYLQARLSSRRATSKQMALSLNSMPADFINAYVLGNVGTTGSMAGACATFLYNLRLAVEDIKSGRHRVVICGSSEAPITPEVLEGFGAMGALASDDRLNKLDGVSTPDHRRASRPFADNCGFVMGESTQYVVLMDDALAVELGADIHGAVCDVHVNADGFKKSISSPGAGNYITLAKAVASAQSILGKESVQRHSMIQAHGSSTPQNRVTESMVFDKVAQAFDIHDWPVTAVKAFCGHPLGPASGDQLVSALGIFNDGVLPGIKTADRAADDVLNERLDIVYQDKQANIDVAFLNSKGFGGNNATATVISPTVVEEMLRKRYDETGFKQWQCKREKTRTTALAYDESACHGDLQIIYNFGQGIIDEGGLCLSTTDLSLSEFTNCVDLNFINPYADMTD